MESVVEPLLFSSPSPTLRLTPLTSALRAARAHDAVLRIGIPRSASALHQDSRGYFGRRPEFRVSERPLLIKGGVTPELIFFTSAQRGHTTYFLVAILHVIISQTLWHPTTIRSHILASEAPAVLSFLACTPRRHSLLSSAPGTPTAWRGQQ